MDRITLVPPLPGTIVVAVSEIGDGLW